MFEIGGYVLSGVIAIVGLTRFAKLIPIVKDIRRLIQKYDLVTKDSSAGGKTITESEWKALAEEALALVRDVASWWSWRSQQR